MCAACSFTGADVVFNLLYNLTSDGADSFSIKDLLLPRPPDSDDYWFPRIEFKRGGKKWNAMLGNDCTMDFDPFKRRAKGSVVTTICVQV